MSGLPKNWLDRFVYRLSGDPSVLGYSIVKVRIGKGLVAGLVNQLLSMRDS